VNRPEASSSMAQIGERLARARRTWRLGFTLRDLLRGTTLLLAGCFLALAADNLFALPGWLRAAFAVALAAGAATVFVLRLVYNLARPLTDEMVAVHLERAAGGMENHLINAVLLKKEQFEDPLTRRMAERQFDETLETVRALKERKRLPEQRAFRTWAAWACIAAAATGLYALLFADRFANALQRYAHPTRFIAPLTATRLTVSPGNADLLQGETLEVEARVDGMLPEKALVRYTEADGSSAEHVMPFEGGVFAWRFSGVQNPFQYRVQAGDAASDLFRVSVRTRPAVKEVKLVRTFPEYMGRAVENETSPIGNISGPVGMTVALEAVADRPISTAALAVRAAAPGQEAEASRTPMSVAGSSASGKLELARSGQYLIEVKDAAGVANKPVTAQLVAAVDEAPVVRITDPAKDIVAAPGDRISVAAAARDDFSLRGLSLFVQLRAGAEWKKQAEWKYPTPRREGAEGVVLRLDEIGCAAGEALSYYFVADDGKPGRAASEGRSRTYTITVMDKAAVEQKQKAEQEAFLTLVRKLIGLQETNLAATKQTAEWPASAKADLAADSAARTAFAGRVGPLVKAEEELYSQARDSVRAFSDLETPEALEALASIAAHEITQSVERLNALRAVAANDHEASLALAAADVQTQVIDQLRKLLADPKALLAERLAASAQKEKAADKPDDLNQNRQRVEKMVDALKQFQEEQKEVIGLSKRLGEIAVDDFTKEDDKTLQKVVDAEAKWAKYFQEAATDLSKLPPQDFSIPNLAKEYVEIYSEVKKAADADQMKTVELAVPLEQGGLELAKSIETNLEKWLMETPDRIAWKMEDPVQDYDVPLADLPDQLEDIVGDLMEKEDDLLAEAEDATSAWLDSMDKGVGWTAMDGPISDMSAKGVTGNMLPNQQEVGGRSGEGRTGKSSGQYVEETSVGKGGRQTPTRLTQDPFEAGVIKDTGPEANTGSSGGGKASGFGQEGLEGPVPAAVQKQLKRMANQQQQLIDQAKRIDFGLQKYQCPRGELPKTIELMQQVQQQFDSGKMLSTAGSSQKVILSNLRDVKDVVSRQKVVNRSNASLPKEMRDEIAASAGEEVPEQYRELVNGYFKALSEDAAKE